MWIDLNRLNVYIFGLVHESHQSRQNIKIGERRSRQCRQRRKNNRQRKQTEDIIFLYGMWLHTNSLNKLYIDEIPHKRRQSRQNIQTGDRESRQCRQTERTRSREWKVLSDITSKRKCLDEYVWKLIVEIQMYTSVPATTLFHREGERGREQSYLVNYNFKIF